MSGAPSIPFTYWALFHASEDQKPTFLVLAGVSIVLAAYFVWARERSELISLRAKLGAAYSLGIDNLVPSLDLENNVNALEIRFQLINSSDMPIRYLVESLSTTINQIVVTQNGGSGIVRARTSNHLLSQSWPDP